jgi:hypothetical protein
MVNQFTLLFYRGRRRFSSFAKKLDFAALLAQKSPLHVCPGHIGPTGWRV